MREWLVRRRRTSLAVAGAILGALAAAACGSSSSTTTAPTPVKCALQVTLPQPIHAGGGTGSINVATTADCAWTATSSVNWITGLSPASGQGEGQVRFEVLPNGSSTPREGDVSLSGVTARISQLGRGCQVALDPAAVSMNPPEGIGSVSVQTGAECSWTASAAESWIAITAGATGTGSSTIRFRVSENGGPARASTIAIGDQVLVVTQAAAAASPVPVPTPAPTPTPTPPPSPACTYSISPTAETVKADRKDGKPITVTTQAGCAWTATSNAGWLTITSASSGTGSGTVTWRHDRNDDRNDRTGTLTIAGRTFTVTQEGR